MQLAQGRPGSVQVGPEVHIAGQEVPRALLALSYNQRQYCHLFPKPWESELTLGCSLDPAKEGSETPLAGIHQGLVGCLAPEAEQASG